MKNKQALVKLAQLQLAINHVLRSRQMTKQAFWPFSSKPKYKFQTDPNWQDNPEAVKELFQMAEGELDQWKTGPARKFLGKLRKDNYDTEYALANKFGLRPPGEYTNGSINGLSEFLPKDTPLTDTDKETIKAFIAANNDKKSREGRAMFNWGPERINYYLNKGVSGLPDLASNVGLEPEYMDFEKPFIEPSDEDKDWESKRLAVNDLINKYEKEYAGLPDNENKLVEQYANLFNKYLNSQVDKHSDSEGYWNDDVWDDFNYEPDEVRETWKETPGVDGKNALRKYLQRIRTEDKLNPEWFDISQIMRKDPSYSEIKDKLLALGKKYNL